MNFGVFMFLSLHQKMQYGSFYFAVLVKMLIKYKEIELVLSERVGTINSNLDSISESLSMLDSNGYKHLALLNGCAGTVIYIKIKGAYILTGFVYAVNVWIANLPEGPSNIYPDQTAKILAISEAGGISVGYVNNVAGITVPDVGNYYIYGIIHTG